MRHVARIVALGAALCAGACSGEKASTEKAAPDKMAPGATTPQTKLPIYFDELAVAIGEDQNGSWYTVEGRLVAAGIVGDKPKGCVWEMQVYAVQDGKPEVRADSWDEGRETPRDLPIDVATEDKRRIRGAPRELDLVVHCKSGQAVVAAAWDGSGKSMRAVPVRSVWQRLNGGASVLSEEHE